MDVKGSRGRREDPGSAPPAVPGAGDLPLQAAGEALQLPEDVHRGASVLLGRYPS